MNANTIISRRAIYLLSLPALVLAGALVSGLAQNSAGTSRLPSPGRFQLATWNYAVPNVQSHGCYVLDTLTGELWMAESGPLKKISEPLK